MPRKPSHPDRPDQPDFFDEEATPHEAIEDPEAARIIERFRRHERPEVVDAEIEEAEDESLDEADEPPAEEPVAAEDETPAEAVPAEETPVEPAPAREQTEAQRTDAKRYEAIHNRLFLVDILATAAALAVFLFLGLSTNLRVFIEQRMSENAFAVVALYGVIVTIVYYFVILFPLHYVDYWHELQFGLSRQSFAAWLADEFKSMGLNMILLVVFSSSSISSCAPRRRRGGCGPRRRGRCSSSCSRSSRRCSSSRSFSSGSRSPTRSSLNGCGTSSSESG